MQTAYEKPYPNPVNRQKRHNQPICGKQRKYKFHFAQNIVQFHL
jgi:hypothetical protein